MAYITGSKPFNQIVIPGTHDTGTFGSGCSSPIARTQMYNIGEQLNGGIRFMDIRVAWFGGLLYTVHTVTCGSYNDVLSDIRDFLTAHPTEILIIRLRAISLGGNYDDVIIKRAYEYLHGSQGNFLIRNKNTSGQWAQFDWSLDTFRSLREDTSKGGVILAPSHNFAVPVDGNGYNFSQYVFCGGDDSGNANFSGCGGYGIFAPYEDIQHQNWVNVRNSIGKVYSAPYGHGAGQMNVMQTNVAAAGDKVWPYVKTNNPLMQVDLRNHNISPPQGYYSHNVIQLDFFNFGIDGDESASATVLRMNPELAYTNMGGCFDDCCQC